MGFYSIVIFIALLFLIGCLVFIGFLMQYQNAGQTFPPAINSCPDNWTVQGNVCVVPTGGSNLGHINTIPTAFIAETYGISNKINVDKNVFTPTDGSTIIDFNDPGWQKNGSTICNKTKWANRFRINWDGVSNTTAC
jgi:hypothetical protein